MTSVEPDPGGFTVETAGGDSFLALTVDEGTEVVVLGYEGEPYLRFSADGTVEQNLNSPATYINNDRYGANDLAPEAAGRGRDHARAGMGRGRDRRQLGLARPPDPRDAPRLAGRRGESYAWSAPVVLEVDGTEVEVNGEITFVADVSPLLWFASRWWWASP